MKPNVFAALQAPLIIVAFSLPAVLAHAQPGAGSPLGKTDITACLSAIPLPPKTPAEALLRSSGPDWRNPDANALDRFYQPSIEKANHAIEQYNSYYENKTQAYYDGQDSASMRAAAVDQANQNPIIAGMGGADKVTQMSPEQARAAALQASAAYQANPYAANGIQSAGMTALYQKVASDPAYAARFQKMSDKEREVELRKYMATDKPQINTAAEVAAHQQRVEQQSRQTNKIRTAMEFRQQIQVFTEKIGQIQTQYADKRANLLKEPGNHDAIRAEFAPKYAAVPIVELGEYGHDKDPVQMLRLNREESARHRAFATRVLQQDILLLQELQADLKTLTAEYMAYFNAHRNEINGDMAGQLNGTETESLFAGMETALIQQALEVAEQAKNCTKEAAMWERQWIEQSEKAGGK